MRSTNVAAPSKVGEYLTCGGKCAKAKREKLKAARARKCETCGKEFHPRWRQIRAGGGRFCSQKCNTAGREAMNSEEAQKRARATWKERFKANPFSKKGAANPRWTGGKRAAYLRQKEAGGYRQACATRRSMTLERLPPGTVERIGKLQRWKCAVCGVGVKDRFELDHIEPLSRGGKHVSDNVQILCKKCNRSKGAKDPVEFMQSKGKLL